MPINGRIYELDGLREAPIDLGPIKEGEDWLTTVRPIIARRIEKYNEGEIHFNLMAVIGDRKAKYEKRLAEIAEVRKNCEKLILAQNWSQNRFLSSRFLRLIRNSFFSLKKVFLTLFCLYW